MYHTLHCNHSNKVTSEVQWLLHQHIGFIVCCSYVSFVCILCFYPVALCIAYRVLLFFCTRCGWHSVCQCLLLGRLFSVGLCSSTCIWSVVLVLLRFCSHVVSRLCPCFLYRGFVLIFYVEALSLYYIEALSSYFILRLWPRILFWGFVLIF